MSQENLDVVRRALAALDSRDVEAYLETVRPTSSWSPRSWGSKAPASAMTASGASSATWRPGLRRDQRRRDRGDQARHTSWLSSSSLPAARDSSPEPRYSSPACTTSNTGRSAAPTSTPTAPRPSKPWGCRNSPLAVTLAPSGHSATACDSGGTVYVFGGRSSFAVPPWGCENMAQ